MYRRGRRFIRCRDFYFTWILGPFRWGTFPVRRPKLWWLGRRIALHYRYGFPLPAVIGWNAIEA